MELRNLITFIHVAELGSFTKAAEALSYSQSTVSFQIKQLEEEIGCLLFERINLCNPSAHGGGDPKAAHRPSVTRFFNGNGTLPAFPVAYRAGNLPVFAEDTYPTVGYSPPLRSLLA